MVFTVKLGKLEKRISFFDNKKHYIKTYNRTNALLYPL